MCAHNSQEQAKRKVHILKVTQQMAARIWHRGVYSNLPTTGNHRTGGEVWYLRFNLIRAQHYCAALWWRCDRSCTSSFTDDVVFAHNGQEHTTRKKRILNVIQQGATRIWHRGVYEQRVSEWVSEWVSECVDLYSALSLRTSKAPDAL